MNKIELSFEDIELINRALMTRRWNVEKNTDEGRSHPDFTHTAQLMDRLSVNHDGATLQFKPRK